MLFSLLIPPLVALTTKTIGTIVTTTVVSTVAANVAHDVYQKAKEEIQSNDSDQLDNRS